MPKIIKTYPFTQEEALALSMFYGYKTKIVDESLLDADGNVPVVQGKNPDGSLRFQMLQDWSNDLSTLISETERLDDAGNPMPYMEAVDVYIINPINPVDFLSANFDDFVKEWFIAPAVDGIKKAQEADLKVANKTAEATIVAVEKAVADKIITLIE